MTSRETISNALDELRAHAGALRTELEETENAIAALQRVLSPDQAPLLLVSEPQNGTLEDATWPDAAEYILRHAGAPLHSREILNRLQAVGYRADEDPKKLKLSLVGALSRNSGNGGRFVQKGGGVYGLAGRDS